MYSAWGGLEYLFYEVNLLTRTNLVYPIKAYCLVVAIYFSLNREVQESKKNYWIGKKLDHFFLFRH